MTPKLFLTFSVGGGIPPATSELLRIYQDARAICLVGNAWPEGEPQDEVGLYQTKLSLSDFTSIKAFVSENRLFDLEERYGRRGMDSGFNVLRLSAESQTRRTKWGPFATIPEPLKELRAQLRDILQETRKHPVQGLKTVLRSASDTVAADQPLQVEFTISNPGHKPLRSFTREEGEAEAAVLRLYAASSQEVAGYRVPPLEFFHAGKPLSWMEPASGQMLSGPVELSPGQELQFQAAAPFSFEQPGTYTLYGFAQPRIEVTLDGEPLTLETLMTTQPVTVSID